MQAEAFTAFRVHLVTTLTEIDATFLVGVSRFEVVTAASAANTVVVLDDGVFRVKLRPRCAGTRLGSFDFDLSSVTGAAIPTFFSKVAVCLDILKVPGDVGEPYCFRLPLNEGSVTPVADGFCLGNVIISEFKLGSVKERAAVAF